MGHSMRRAVARFAGVAVSASMLVLGAAVPAAAVSADIVVSQIYGGGGNGGRLKTIDYDVVHINAEFYDQASDHDPQVARIKPGN
jgi:hypothetical protein